MDSSVFSVYGGPRNPRAEAKTCTSQKLSWFSPDKVHSFLSASAPTSGQTYLQSFLQGHWGIKTITGPQIQTVLYVEKPTYQLQVSTETKSTNWSSKLFAEISHSLWFIWYWVLCKVYPLTAFFPPRPLLADMSWWMRTDVQSTAGAEKLPQMAFFNGTRSLNQLHGLCSFILSKT